MKLLFLVQGSSAEPYEVSFHSAGAALSAFCTCAAGEQGVPCKHRYRLMRGDPAGVLAGVDLLPTLLNWVVASPLSAALAELDLAEKNSALAKSRLAKAKENLAKLMYGRT